MNYFASVMADHALSSSGAVPHTWTTLSPLHHSPLLWNQVALPETCSKDVETLMG